VSDQIARGAGFRQIADWYREAIASKELAAGASMPSEAEIVARWNVSRVTVRRALAVLEDERLVEVVPGRGRRVCGIAECDGDGVGDALYERIASAIQAEIAGGAYQDGRVPGEASLAAQFRASVGTVRMALRLLESDGVIKARRGLGRFVVGSPLEASGGPADRVVDAVRAQIASGELADGQKLPSEADLVTRHSVSRGAVRRALAELEEQGTIESVQGVGRYVRVAESAS